MYRFIFCGFAVCACCGRKRILRKTDSFPFEIGFRLRFMLSNSTVRPETVRPPFDRPKNLWLKIAFGILLCELAGVLGAFFTFSSVRDWYPTLIKPPWTPPAWAFGPIWTLLFALIGAALGLILASGDGQAKGQANRKKRGLLWFGIQLVLNVAWSATFFGMRSPGWAYAIVILLWLSIAATLWIFSKISRTAGWLLVPYLAWVTFASALNFGILSLNVLKPTVEQMDADPRNGPVNTKPGATLR